MALQCLLWKTCVSWPDSLKLSCMCASVACVQIVYTYDDAWRWAVQIAEGLSFLHHREPMLLHRDVKCDNILLVGEALRFYSSIASIIVKGCTTRIWPSMGTGICS